MDILQQLYLVTLSHLANIIYATCLFLIGTFIAWLIKKICKKAIAPINNPTLAQFIPKTIYMVLMMIITIAALSTLGVPTASLLTVLGAFSLAIGFALKDFLANIAASIVIISLKPFKIGDYVVIANCEGKVAEINLFMTQLISVSNEALFIPNRKIINDAIVNKALFEKRRLDLEIGISYKANIAKSKEILHTLLADNPLIIAEPAPIVAVKNLSDSSVILLIRFWVERQNFVRVKLELMESIKLNFEQNNIDIPYPQLEVHIKST